MSTVLRKRWQRRCSAAARGAQRSKTAPHGQHFRGCSGAACTRAVLAASKTLEITDTAKCAARPGTKQSTSTTNHVRGPRKSRHLTDDPSLREQETQPEATLASMPEDLWRRIAGYVAPRDSARNLLVASGRSSSLRGALLADIDSSSGRSGLCTACAILMVPISTVARHLSAPS